MTAEELREAIERHPSVFVLTGYAPTTEKPGPYPAPATEGTYHRRHDLREVALRIIEMDFPIRMLNWWGAMRNGSEDPANFLSYDIELAAYRLIAAAATGQEMKRRQPAGSITWEAGTTHPQGLRAHNG